jgi:CubicO group peptidase (beta-lactamase class C family)
MATDGPARSDRPSGARPSEARASIPDDLRDLVEHRLRERGTRGLALAAFDATGICFAGGVGLADVARGEPVTTSTVFRVASISKLLTTTLVLQLVEDVRLDLDRPVNDLLPAELAISDPTGRAAADPGPTPRSLLSHSSGLPAGVRGAVHTNRAISYLSGNTGVRTLADAVSGLAVVRPPGEELEYSNPGFNVLGFLAAAALDRPFEVAVRDRVLEPLGMSDSVFAAHARGAGVATPYGSTVPPGAGSRRADRMRLVATPMGGLCSTVEDLARFGRMVLGRGRVDGRRVLGSDTLLAATSMQAMNHPLLDQGYGLGFKVRTWRGRTIVGHDGNMPGVATQLVLSPEDGVGVVVLTNGYPLGVPHEIAAAALAHLLDLAPDDALGRVGPSSERDLRGAESMARRAEGTYRVDGSALPGLAGRIDRRLQRITVTHELGGRLRVDGHPGFDGSVWLHPGSAVGRYRASARVADGTAAIVEERPDGVHLWMGHTDHLRRRSGVGRSGAR